MNCIFNFVCNPCFFLFFVHVFILMGNPHPWAGVAITHRETVKIYATYCPNKGIQLHY